MSSDPLWTFYAKDSQTTISELADDNSKLSAELAKVKAELASANQKLKKYTAANKLLTSAINNKGRSPSTHDETRKRHRKEWPTLWKAIDAFTAINEKITHA